MGKFAFQKGWKQVPNGQMSEMRKEIMAALNIAGDATFYARLKGKPEPKISEYNAITEIFQKHGITDIWGE